MTTRPTEQLTLNGHAFRLLVADGIYSRAVGLLGKAYLDPDEAMLITPCNFVHTLGMRFPIDVAFCDRELRILRITACLVPWRLSPLVRSASVVIEFAAGTAQRTGMVVGESFVRSRS